MRKLISPNTLRTIKKSIFLLCLSLILNKAQAQTPAENLQNAVEIYNAMREYMEVLTSATLTPDQVSDVKARMDKGIPLLDLVIREGNAEEIKTARYFRNNFKYEYSFVLGMKGDNKTAYEIAKEIEREFGGYTSSDFPMRYEFFGKNYVIKWENFAPTQAEFLTGLAEMAYNLSKYDEAIPVNRLALAHPSLTPWLKYISIHKMLDIYNKNSSYLTEVEQLDFALQSIKAYNNLADSEKKTVADYKYPTMARGVNIILEKAQRNVPAALARAGEAAVAAQSDKSNLKVLQLFEICYRNKQAGDASFHQSAEAFAREASSLDAAVARFVGVSAVDRMALATSSSDCAGLQTIIDKYTYWKETAKANEYSKKRQECLENEEKARKRAERISRRSNRHFNVYTGIYIFPLLKSNPHRDYGGVVNFAFKKTALEFSYLSIKKNKDNVFDVTVQDVDAEQADMSRWNGYYAHFQPKFFSNNLAYFGPLFGYAQKNFEPITSNATRDADGQYMNATFNPVQKQYILMANFGGLSLIKGLGADMYMGIGGTYNQWDLGSNINTDEYTIENPVLESRKKSFFSLIIRVGMTIGINFGKGNVK